MTYFAAKAKMSDMKKQIANLLLACGVLYVAAPRPAAAYVDKPVATISIMNKAAGKAQTVSIPVGKKAEFEKLSILVRTCKQTDPFQPEDFYMFIEISKASEGQIFGGWMSKNAPGANPLQNADYDVWLVKCE